MSLDDLADLIQDHLAPDAKSYGVWFSLLDGMPRLMLPPEGLAIGETAAFLADFLEDELGITGISKLPLLDKIENIALTRFDIDPGEEWASTAMFMGFRMSGPPTSLGDIPWLGDISIAQPELTYSRFGADSSQYLVMGTLHIFECDFSVSMSWPEQTFSATYVGTPLKLGHFLKETGLPVGEFECDLTAVSVSTDLLLGTTEVSLGLSKFGFSSGELEFRDTALMVTSDGGQFSGYIQTVMSLDDGRYIFGLDGSFGKAGCQVAGRFHPETPLALSQIAKDLIALMSAGQLTFTPPALLDDVEIISIDAQVDTGDKTYALVCNGQIDADGMSCKIGLSFSKLADGSTEPAGYVLIGDNRFELHLHKPAATPDDPAAPQLDIFAASYGSLPPKVLHLKEDLLDHILPHNAILDAIPSVSLEIEGAVFARLTDKSTGADGATTKVAGLALGASASIDLMGLPLIGSIAKAIGLPGGLGVEGLQVVIASDPLERPEVDMLNATLAGGPARKPEDAPVFQINTDELNISSKDRPALGKGFNLLGQINMPSGKLPLRVGSSGGDSAPAPVDPSQAAADNHARQNPKSATSPVPSPAADAHWFSIQKKLGPIYLEKLGVAFEKGELWVFPAASLTLSGLTISLEGLAVSTPLDHFSPTFHLTGLGLDYRKPPIEIGGAFMRVEVLDDPQKASGAKHDEYYGNAVIKAETFALSAMGGYTRVNGDPSMFLYVDLDMPLGGPPFFFVTGLAAGFGYNRDLIIPGIDDLEKFPFIQAALGHPIASPPKDGAEPKTPGESIADSRDTLTRQIEGMQAYIPPHTGQNWFAAGVHFTSFEIVTGFALVSLSFGHQTEVHVLGAASYSFPPDPAGAATALTRIDILAEAAYLPDEGTLSVDAKIAAGSFIFEPACQLSGSMAFKTWTKGDHKDDFVLTIGGYHPKFKVPAHYPSAKRLAFNWHKSSELSIKGELYFAMTGNFLMAGGGLKGVWESGALKAWLTFDADFLIRYKPFHYDAHMSIQIGAEVTIHFFGTHHMSVHLGAELTIWGPPFAGRASFDIWVASFSVSFGPGRSAPKPLTWPQFRAEFLPKDKPLISIGVQNGLVRELNRYALNDDFSVVATDADSDHHWLINPKHFALSIGPLIPMNSNGRAGVAPMKLLPEHFRSSLKVRIWHPEGEIPEDADFLHSTNVGQVPAGLWGAKYSLELDNERTVKGAEKSVVLTACNSPVTGTHHSVNKDRLAFETETMADSFVWASDQAIYDGKWYSIGAKWGGKHTHGQFDAPPENAETREQVLAAFMGEDMAKSCTARLGSGDLRVLNVTKGGDL